VVLLYIINKSYNGLPKQQPEVSSCWLHISHNFQQKAKRQTRWNGSAFI